MNRRFGFYFWLFGMVAMTIGSYRLAGPDAALIAIGLSSILRTIARYGDDGHGG